MVCVHQIMELQDVFFSIVVKDTVDQPWGTRSLACRSIANPYLEVEGSKLGASMFVSEVVCLGMGVGLECACATSFLVKMVGRTNLTVSA